MQIKTTQYIPASNGGAYTYRIGFPQLTMKNIFRGQGIKFTESFYYITDPKYLKLINTFVVRQRPDSQLTQYLKLLKKISNSYGQLIIFDMDDILKYEDIPNWNIGRKAFKNISIKENLDLSDIITVTTVALKQYLIDTYNISKNKIVIIPNYIPRWWIHPKSLKEQTNTIKAKRPKIILPLSSSHYSSDPSLEDDFSHIINFIRNTTKKYEWIFVSGCPIPLLDLHKNKEISVVKGSTILNYPREMVERYSPSIILAPLKDNIFNRCKSEIKIQEAFSMNIPIIAQDLPMYKNLTEFTFNNENDLQNNIDIILSNKNKYSDIIKNNKNICDKGNQYFKNGFWLENNINKHIDLYFKSIRNTIKINLKDLK